MLNLKILGDKISKAISLEAKESLNDYLLDDRETPRDEIKIIEYNINKEGNIESQVANFQKSVKEINLK